MLRKRFLNLALVIFAGAVFLFGLAHLFTLRFEAGDIYPPYSTLRSDPLGARIFYESLRALPDIAVEQNEKPLSKFPASERTTLFYLGAKSIYWPESEVAALENFVSKGGRLVLTFYPRDEAPDRIFGSPTPEKSPAKNASPSPTSEALTEKVLDQRELGQRWKFQVAYKGGWLDTDARNQLGSILEPFVAWHSAMYFPAVADPWRVVYAIEGRAVIIERNSGAGTIVLASDSYFISNEAMRASRKPALLAWLAGESRRFVFDETHHNVYERPGVANLLRKYRLHGLIAGLLLLLALFVWKSAASFLPRDRAGEDGESVIAGRDAYSGFTNLLRRGVRPRDLLPVCLAEWRRSSPQLAPRLEEKLAQFRKSDGDSNARISAAELLRRYEEITRTIETSKWKRTPTA
ncbi:MAG: DUF4350 domain-containing protein [Chthoniobacterales bacterium]